jgi:hypothetical protein
MRDESSWKSSAAGPWAGPVTLALLHLVLALLAFHQGPFTGGDDATYISLARSLIFRHDYTDVWDPALPPHTQYPPVFAGIVAIGLLFGLTPAVGLKLMMIVISTAAVLVSCIWIRRNSTAGVAFCAGFFIAVSPEITRLGREVLSDAPFWLFAILALTAWQNADVASSSHAKGRMPWSWVVLATAATLGAYFTRSAGVPLLVATLIWLGWRRQPRAILIVVGLAVPVILAWWLRGRAHGGGGYLGPFLSVDPYDPSRGTVSLRDLIVRIIENAKRYAAWHLPRLVFGSPRTGFVFGTAFAAAMTFGWVRRMRKPSLPEIWFPLYLGLVLLWPVTWAGARFLLPVVPLIALYVADTIDVVAEYASHPRLFAAAILLAGVITIQSAVRRQILEGRICRERYEAGQQFPCTRPMFSDFFTTAERTRGKRPPNAVVISRKPTLFFLYSGYRSRLYPLSAVPDSLFDLAKRIGAHYLIVDQISDLAPKYLHPVLLARRDDFCVVPSLSTVNAVFMKIEIGGPPPRSGVAENVFRVCGGR